MAVSNPSKCHTSVLSYRIPKPTNQPKSNSDKNAHSQSLPSVICQRRSGLVFLWWREESHHESDDAAYYQKRSENDSYDRKLGECRTLRWKYEWVNHVMCFSRTKLIGMAWGMPPLQPQRDAQFRTRAWSDAS